MESTYYDLKAPIRSLILKENMNFALIFPVDVRKEMRFELYFFRVARVSALERVYVLPEMTPGALQDFNYLGEGGFGSGDDIFAMSDERPYRILHFGVGVYPRNVKVWKQQPSGYTTTGWSKKTPTKAGDPVDYFDGNISPFDEPTKASESVMWLKGSIYFALRNDEPVSVTPKLHILGAGYDVWLINDKSLADKMVKGVIPCRFISVGGLYEGQYTVPDEWSGKGFRYSLSEVQALLRGGG
jgi:hypothetical protein